MSDQSKSHDQILKELETDFLSYQKDKSGRIIYSPELREKVKAAIDAGLTPYAVASVCRISTSAVREWTLKPKRYRSVKRLNLEIERDACSSEFAIIHLSERIRIQIPIACLKGDLLREIFSVGIQR